MDSYVRVLGLDFGKRRTGMAVSVGGLAPRVLEVRVTRDVKEVHTTVCRHAPWAFLGLDARERSELPQYQTYHMEVHV